MIAGATVPPLMEFDAFLNLLADAFLGSAVGGVESLVAAEGAAAGADLPITVGAAESSINAELLHTGAEKLLEIVAI